MSKSEKALGVIGILMVAFVLMLAGIDITKCYVFCGIWDY